MPSAARFTALLILFASATPPLAAQASGATGAATQPPLAADAPYHDAPTRDTEPKFAWVVDSVAEAMGLPHLRRVSLPQDTREIRVWAGFGIVWPQDLIRVVQTPDTVWGEVWEWWQRPEQWDSVDPDRNGLDQIRRWSVERGCPDLRVSGNVAVCLRPESATVDWAEVAGRLDSIGAWEAAFGWPPPSSLDGVSVDVEVLRGDRYNAWGWDNPDPEADGDEGVAAAVLSLIRGLYRGPGG